MSPVPNLNRHGLLAVGRTAVVRRSSTSCHPGDLNPANFRSRRASKRTPCHATQPAKTRIRGSRPACFSYVRSQTMRTRRTNGERSNSSRGRASRAVLGPPIPGPPRPGSMLWDSEWSGRCFLLIVMERSKRLLNLVAVARQPGVDRSTCYLQRWTTCARMVVFKQGRPVGRGEAA